LSFKELNLIEPIQKALKTEGYSEPTPIQEKAIPQLLKGKDLLGCAQTGTGKTAAFAIPILQGIHGEKQSNKGNRQIKALVVAPTRELAIQIAESFRSYGKNLGLKTLVIYGGVGQNPQTKELRQGVDILVATPGRLLDLINQGFVSLKNIKYFVLDEADMMLDMGMLKDVRKIIGFIPKVRQTMFFSATMPTEIGELAKSILNDPVRIDITPVSSTVEIIEQRVYSVDKVNKTNLLIHLLKDKEIDSALVFSRTKHGANKIAASLSKAGFTTEAIHGNKSQTARQLALSNFKKRKTRILVATDIAARGIDIDELSHVINYDLPEVPETYVSFCDYGEKPLLRSIQKLTSRTIEEVEDHPFPLVDTTIKPKERSNRRPSASRPSVSNEPRQKGKQAKNGKVRREKRANDSVKTNPKKNGKRKS
jgi:ATP-dependent RNA helicase RhlE